jgi:glycosyltransferase involved in cell wall biosynthesis
MLVHDLEMSKFGVEPLVTVVTPTFNRLELLRESLASVVAQTYPHWQMVIVDDGSTDDTVAAVRAFGDPRVQVIARPHVGHIGMLRNAGAAAGAGEFIAFLDSDDVWVSDKLERQVAEMRRHGVMWSYTGFEMMDSCQQPIPMKAGVYRPLSGWIVGDLLADRTGVMTSTLVVSRQLFESIGGYSENPRLTHRGDLELALRLTLTAETCGLPETLTRVREHMNRTTATLSTPFERTALVYDEFLALKLPPDVRRAARRCRARHLLQAARQRHKIGQYAGAAGLLGRAVIDRAMSALPMASRR